MSSVITKLQFTKDQKKVSIFVDDKFYTTISPERVLEISLHQHQEIDKKTLQLIKQVSNREKGYLKALNLISYRPRSTKEISDYLSRVLCLDSKTIEAIISKLEKQKYLDDFNFADRFISSRINASKPKGPSLIKVELLKKGVSIEIINQLLVHHFSSSEIQLQFAIKALKKSKYQDLTDFKTRQKAYQFLARKGFSPTIINQLFTSFSID